MAELGLRERANFHSNTAKRLRRYKERTQLLNLVRVVPGFANVTLQTLDADLPRAAEKAAEIFQKES